MRDGLRQTAPVPALDSVAALDALLDDLVPPSVVRLTGPGARALASAWAAQHDAVAEVRVAKPARDGGAAWLDDHPTARIAADALITGAALFDWPWRFVLTGAARDAGHPTFGLEARCPGHAGSSTRSGRAAPVEQPLELLVDEGRWAEARVRAATHPKRAFHWLAVHRLRCLGRTDEALTLATSAPMRTCRQATLQQVGGIWANRGDPERAAQFGWTPPPAEEASSMRHWMAGRYDRAAHVVLRDGRMGLFEVLAPRSPYRSELGAVREALDAGDWRQANLLLDASSRLKDLSGPDTVRWLLFQGRLASEIEDVGRATWAAGSVRRLCAGRPPRMPIRDALPRVPATVRPWSAVHWLSALLEIFPMHARRIEKVLDGLPKQPLTLGVYSLLEPIASGGMGTVWRGLHEPTRTEVAIKVLRQPSARDTATFRTEIETTANFEHPNIAAVLDQFEVSDACARHSAGKLIARQPVLVLELVDGGTLEKRQGQLEWPALKSVLHGLLDALAYAHARGCVHRDVKPANVLVDGDRFLLADFGLSNLRGKIAGTPAYMAPEQFEATPTGPTADLYALGCLAWAMATGLPPFTADTPWKLAKAHASAPLPEFSPEMPLPAALEPWLQRCLAKAPADRFRTATAAAEALRNIELEEDESDGELETFDFGRMGALEETQTTAAPGLQEVFGQRYTRPRIPTPNLLHLGDPPLIGQRELQKALWTRLMRAAGGRQERVCLGGLPGDGRSMAVRWLLHSARISGLEVMGTAQQGALAIIDATGTAPSDWDRHREQTWLLVWCDEMEGMPSLPLRPVGAWNTWSILRSRIMLTPNAAALATTRSGGVPALALDLVEEWLIEPSTQRTPGGLALLGSPGRSRRAVSWWRRRYHEMGAAQRSCAERSAFAFPGSFEERAGESTSVAEIALPLNGGWLFPRELQEAVRGEVDPDMVRAAHRALALATEQPLHRAYHEVQGGGGFEAVEALRDAVVGSWLLPPVAVLELLQFSSQAELVSAPIAAAMRRVRVARGAALRALVRDPDPQVALLALVRTAPRWTNQDLKSAQEAVSTVASVPMVRFRLATRVARALRDRGHREDGLRVLDDAWGLALDAGQDDIWRTERAYVSGSGLEGAVAALRDLSTRRNASINLADARMQIGDFTGALTAIEQSLGLPSQIACFNRMSIQLALGSFEAADRSAREAYPFCAPHHPDSAAGMLAVITTASCLRGEAGFRALLPVLKPVQDPLLCRVLRPWVEQLSPSHQARLEQVLVG